MGNTRQPRDAEVLSSQWSVADGIDVGGTGRNTPMTDRARLEQTIEEQIIPRLMLMHRDEGSVPGPQSVASPGVLPKPEHVAELARLVIAPSVDPALAFIEGQRERGMPLERIYLDLFVPTARLLGEMWNADYCSFTDVTIGLWRLQQLVHKLSPAFLNESEPRQDGRRLLLVPEPGEQHTFGLIMVAEFFRRAGWDVWDQPLNSRAELLDVVRREHFSVVGLSIGSVERLETLTETIRLLRSQSRNAQLRVMVGGAPFVELPSRVRDVGADSTAMDGEQAIAVAEDLVLAGHVAAS
jgi:methanogenic corrinoid protein MtbC1